MLFDNPLGYSRTIASSALAPAPGSDGIPVADTLVPLNIFEPRLGVSDSGSSLVVDTAGLYELSFNIGVQFAPSAPFEIFVMETNAGVDFPIAATIESVPAGTILQPRLFAKTAQACLSAGAQLSLYVRVETIGVLRIIPGAALSVRRIGDC